MSDHSVKIDHEAFMLLWDVQLMLLKETHKTVSMKSILADALLSKYSKKAYPKLHKNR